jgi:hypothetical protein
VAQQHFVREGIAPPSCFLLPPLSFACPSLSF